jgi:hypothetical protein
LWRNELVFQSYRSRGFTVLILTVNNFLIFDMPTKNVTIDNISPLISYSPVGAWSEGNSSDPFFAK